MTSSRAELRLPDLRPLAHQTIERLHVREASIRTRLEAPAALWREQRVRLARELDRTIATREQLQAALVNLETHPTPEGA